MKMRELTLPINRPGGSVKERSGELAILALPMFCFSIISGFHPRVVMYRDEVCD